MPSSNWFDSMTSAIPGVGTAIGAIGGAVEGAVNLYQQQQTRDYMKDLQKEMFQREDTAVQRRAADLKAAGINPLLAAGQAAQAGPVVPIGTPQSNVASGAAQGADAVLGLMRGFLQNDQLRAQTELTKVQAQKVNTDITAQELSNEFAASTNPLRKSAMELQLAFDQAANPERLQFLASQIKSLDADVVNKGLDSKLKELGITQAQLDIVRQKYANQAAFENLNIQQKESMLKSLAVDALVLSNRQLQQETQAGIGKARAEAQWKSALGMFGPLVGAKMYDQAQQ